MLTRHKYWLFSLYFLSMSSSAFAVDPGEFWLWDTGVTRDCKAVCDSRNLNPVSSGISKQHNKPFFVCRLDFDSHGQRAGFNLRGEGTCATATGRSNWPNYGTSTRTSRKQCLCRTGPVSKEIWISGTSGFADCAYHCGTNNLSAVATDCYKGSLHSQKRMYICSINAFSDGWRSGFNVEGDEECGTGSGGQSIAKSSSKKCLCYNEILPESCISGASKPRDQSRPKDSSRQGTAKLIGTKQAPYTGNIYYLAEINIPGATLLKIRNPNFGLGKQWLVQIIPLGSTSEDCGRPGKTIDIAPGSSTTVKDGESLSHFKLGFCLTTKDKYTHSVGLPPKWELHLDYQKAQ